MTEQPNTLLNAVKREVEFTDKMSMLMEHIFAECTRKVNADYRGLPTVVTERQVEHSLRNVPDTIRSRMIQRCCLHFGARKEP